MSAPRRYRGPSWWPLGHLLYARERPGVGRVLILWIVVTVVAVVSAVLEATFNWSGMPLRLGGVTIAVTVYPPAFLTVPLAVWLGPLWGAIPAYVATLASALTSGMGLGVSALFALASPVEVLVLWGSMVTLGVHPDLVRWQDLRRYLLIAILAPTASSLAALIWNNVHQLDLLEGQRVWQGWVIGDFILITLLAPLFHWAGPSVRHWLDQQFADPPHREMNYRRSLVLVGSLVVIMVALVLEGMIMIVNSLDLSANLVTASGEPLYPRLREIGLYLGLLVAVMVVTTGTFTAALARRSERHRRVALRDSLTGAYGRQAFGHLFQREADRSRRLGKSIALIYFDLDRFKAVNDTYGHEIGDRVLRQVVRRVRIVSRDHDLIFRWGGEEFVLVLPHTDAADAVALAERIRIAVAAEPILSEEGRPPVWLTLSLGTAGAQHPVDADSLLRRADAACYLAKHRGRNRAEGGDHVGGGLGAKPPGDATGRREG